MLFYFDKKNQLQKVDFREWLDLCEGSFDRENMTDVPDWFYVCPFFSQDLIGPKPGITPSGAVASLVGIEGISEKKDIINSFYEGVALQMPGKATALLNKFTRTPYDSRGDTDNEDYHASKGHQAGRRLLSGSEKGFRKTQQEVFARVVEPLVNDMKQTHLPSLYDVFNKEGKIIGTVISPKYNNESANAAAKEKFPDVELYTVEKKLDQNALMQKDGTTISTKDIIRQLKDNDPVRLTRHGKVKPREIKDKRMRLRHKGNNLKNIENSKDLATRLTFILRNVVGIDKMGEASETTDRRSKFDELVYDFVNAHSTATARLTAKALATRYPQTYNQALCLQKNYADG